MLTEFLGQGWAFPVRVNARGAPQDLRMRGCQRGRGARTREIRSGDDLARHAGGGGPFDHFFAPNNANTRAVIASEVRTALIRFEPRIDVLAVKAGPQIDAQNTLLIAVDYRIRANNSVRNIVYPFFLNEGPA
jgi:phage baseplate assembly protein W